MKCHNISKASLLYIPNFGIKTFLKKEISKKAEKLHVEGKTAVRL